MRKWREDEEMEREWEWRYIHSLRSPQVVPAWGTHKWPDKAL